MYVTGARASPEEWLFSNYSEDQVLGYSLDSAGNREVCYYGHVADVDSREQDGLSTAIMFTICGGYGAVYSAGRWVRWAAVCDAATIISIRISSAVKASAPIRMPKYPHYNVICCSGYHPLIQNNAYNITQWRVHCLEAIEESRKSVSGTLEAGLACTDQYE